MYKFGRTSTRRAKGVYADLFACAALSLSQMKRHDMRIPWAGGLRSAALQNEIFNTGASRCDGYKKESYHQSGKALDVVPHNSDNEELAYYQFAALMFKNWAKGGYVGRLEWGGHWSSFEDLPHWQVIT